MSLKDDFLEALRSVKRDFFKDYEYTDTQENETLQSQINDSQPKAEPMGESPLSAAPREEPAAGSTAPASGYDSAASAAVRELHTQDVAQDTFDEETVAPDVDPTPFRVVDERPGKSGGYGEYASPAASRRGAYNDDDYGIGMPATGDGRVIFDEFDSGESGGSDKTVISKNTVIRGALQTEDSIRMFGQIMGDIDCKSNILVAGKVRGNTSAANAYIIDAQVDGNLLCDDVVNISDDAWILGNVRAQQAEIDGKVKGNIEIRHAISIGSNSSVIGNISTDELEIKRGAFINGQIMMYSPSRDVIDKFDQFER